MKRTIVLSICLNLVLAIVMVLGNIWALQQGLEETFVALALLYGVAVTVANALLLSLAGRSGL